MALIYPGSGLTDTDFSDGQTDSGYQPHLFLYGADITIPSSGTVTQLGVKFHPGGGGPFDVKFGLYNSSGTLLAQSTATSPSGTSTLAWLNSGAISAAVSAGKHYVLVSVNNTNGVYGFDTSGNGSFATEAYGTAMQASESITDGGDTGQLYGVRLDFTASGGGAQPALIGNFLLREMLDRVRKIGSGWKRNGDGRLLVPAYPALT